MRNQITFFTAATLMLLSTASMAQEIELNEFTPIDKPFTEVMAQRQTFRSFSEEPLSNEELSTVLWCAYGYNRPEEKKRTAPSARNVQETDIYVFMESGVYLYYAEEKTLKQVVAGDHRKIISQQPHFAEAPVAIVMVSNYDRMKGFDTEARDFYAAVDCGYISQNIYLCCAASDNLGTVACGGINREAITQLLKLKNARVQLAHPVGHVK